MTGILIGPSGSLGIVGQRSKVLKRDPPLYH